MTHQGQPLRIRLGLAAVAALGMLGPAAAQDTPTAPGPGRSAQGPAEAPPASVQQPGGGPATSDGRYVFYRVQDSIIRLDSRTGQVSQCSGGAPGWSCQTVPTERAALESEIARLQGENATLKKELLARSIPLPDGLRSETPAAKAPEATPGIKTPTDADLDRVMTFMEKVWRRLVEMMSELQRDPQRKG